MKYHKYEIFHSAPTTNRNRKWAQEPTGHVLLPPDTACNARAESEASPAAFVVWGGG